MAVEPPRIPWSQKLIVIGWSVILAPALIGFGVVVAMSIYFAWDDPRRNGFAFAAGPIALIGLGIFVVLWRRVASYRRLQEVYAAEQAEEGLDTDEEPPEGLDDVLDLKRD